MIINRKLAYGILLAYYYTFVMIYSWNLGYTDVIVSTIVITLVSYLWLVRIASKMGAYAQMNVRDLVINVFLYSFITFYIAGMALFLAGKGVDFWHAFLMITPITIWTGIWTDFYMQKLKGRM